MNTPQKSQAVTPGRGSQARACCVLMAVAALAGCAQVNLDQSLGLANQRTADFTQGQLALARTPEQRADMRQAAHSLLRQPLSQNDAVRLALLNSPVVQALLAGHWAESADAAQTGRIANPVFTFERIRFADELELGRLLSFGLLDVLTLPWRAEQARQRMDAQQVRLAAAVVEQVTQVRQAWVKAVAARQSERYAEQVNEAAQASAELARRMYAAGNFSKLQRARQHAFHAEATAQWAAARQASLSAREGLIRLLGLDDAQAAQLTLPDRFPDLPTTPHSPENIGQQASRERLDLQLAQMDYARLSGSRTLNGLNTLTDIELGLRRDTVFDNADGHKGHARGFELAVRLPLFDWGDARREALDAQTLAAAHRLEATVRAAGSQVRESYAAYRSAWDIARHYRDEVVPLRKTISEENLLRYNGMLIGVFELLADSREQIHSVIAAIAAEEQFWLSEAALQASLVGTPTTAAGGLKPLAPAKAGGGDAGH